MTVRYWKNGELDHLIDNTKGNGSYEDGQRIGAIVDLTSIPHKVAFYINYIEQPNYVIGIPSEIRFWAFIQRPSSSFTVVKYHCGSNTVGARTRIRPMGWPFFKYVKEFSKTGTVRAGTVRKLRHTKVHYKDTCRDRS
ncbi:MAG: hypothetical protein EZS28_032337 [Streblomastix strix]|uniref:B30.2/SPRY domain-containing protein n=1 Tax=Streblomastix strix TaxID=222440 RepID=A0A5J4UNX7_9EUKA|nr:MAG: hypothetical protein EZS28_032337 [Streblomastix strix]